MANQDLKPGERLDKLLIDDLELIQDPKHFCFSLDAVLLANFVNPKKKDRVLDLGTGTGVIPHLTQAKYDLQEVWGIDIQQEVIDMAQRSAKYNKLEDKLNFTEIDLKEALEFFGSESFDYIISNPPYMKVGSGKVSPKKEVAIARYELECKLEDIVKVSNQLVKYGGKVAYIHRAKRLAELLALMKDYNLTPKRMRLIHSSKDSKAKLVLVEAVKGGGSGLEIKDPVIVYNKKGNYTTEIENMYHPERD
ncbi:putative O-methyltransferase [Halobacteroides halobius DSM 5150]|uniref:Putative O-methyltransferase n=1 Tax=Halobacteroides halobius (strain ATCC 35273 / DSM 5150 / MD-1) TaxID=748449 RepID=L0K6C0_HALHC|nr:tRNA1(Val) (adenine(37)-N6)-methyltransferase [Halobacteroides halobius]AGB40085.1 putative O-methyltransferase [Halobacteroides halobius DSM 5150]